MPFGDTNPEQDEKIDRCISKIKGTNERTGKPYTDSEKVAICKSQVLGTKSYYFTDLNLKNEGEEFYIDGVASSINEDLGNDTMTEEALNQMSDIINKGNVKLGFDHTELLAGRPTLEAVGKLIEAKVEHGKLKVRGVLDKTFTHFKDIVHKIKNKYLDGLSIEYQVDPNKTVVDFKDGIQHRIIGGLRSLVGMALTPRPMNTDALFDYYVKHLVPETNEVIKMEQKTETKNENSNNEGKSIDFAELGRKAYEQQIENQKQTELKALLAESIKAELKNVKMQEPYINSAQKFMMEQTSSFDAELKNWRETIKDSKASLHAKYDAAAKLHNALSKYGIDRRNSSLSGSYAWKKNAIKIGGANNNEFQLKSFEYKAELEHDTNKVLDTDYYQNAAELNDVYGPVILDHLNNKTTYYGLLRKVDDSMIGSDRHGFRIRTGRIAGAGGDTSTYNYDEGATITGQNATKIKVQAPFMQYGVTPQLSGLTIAEARGSMGDVFAKEVMLATADLLKGINVDLLGTAVGFTDGGKVTGLQVFGDDGSTYANLYGHARSTYTTLQGNLRAQTGSPNITKVLLRQIIRDCEIDGADRNSLVIVCHPIQRDKILGLMDPAQRYNEVSAKAGFEGLPTFDGIPIHTDVDATNTVLHVVPMDKTYLAVLLPPTMEDKEVLTDSKRALIKTYFAHVMEQPNHGGIITGLSNS